ncbi:M48 family metallopeptidase [Dyella telluris]|uniref:M48 family metallopeptidase n=1 Tax=Dyella telluris TaxID=2763498 RepID=A0A7G8Q6Y3_9GAMM|nr:M48 family metallopeptidase [Dyella telluris]QNK02541.1 M48 family metallopeptidase [Dyella telluris]
MVPATYFDGRSTRATPVSVWREEAMLRWRTADRLLEWQAPLQAIEPSAGVIGLPYTLRLVDGAHLQIEHDQLPDDWFPRHHRLERLVDWLERRWPAALAGIAVIVVALAGLFEFGVPWAADRIASHIPSSLENAMGTRSLAALEGHLLLPTTLTTRQQAHYQAVFQRFVQNMHDLPEVRLHFYKAPAIGANAFAMPGGTVVFTDELAKALPDDEAFIAVIAHELGHQAHHHMMRQVLRGSGVFIVAGMLMGDVTSLGGITAGVPTFLINAHYTRGFESDADRFAFDALARDGIDPVAFVHAMQALQKAHPGLNEVEKDLRYVSSHPMTVERIAQANKASQAFRAHATGKTTAAR